MKLPLPVMSSTRGTEMAGEEYTKTANVMQRGESEGHKKENDAFGGLRGLLAPSHLRL